MNIMKFEAIKNLSNELKNLLAEWEEKRTPLLEAKKKLIEAETAVQNSYDMEAIKHKNAVIEKVGYTLADVEEALKRWHKARFEAIRDFNISAKLSEAVKIDEAKNKGRKADFERLKSLQDDFITKVAPIVRELSNERETALNDVIEDFDYIMQKRRELTPTDTRNVHLSRHEYYFTTDIVRNLINEISSELFDGVNEKPIQPHY